MKKFFSSFDLSKIKAYMVAHKVITGIAIVVVLFGGYKLEKKLTDTSGETRYVLGTVTNGSISTTVDASGQVSASNEISLTAKSSGDITSVRAKAGDQVSQGALIASIDSTDASIALRDAQISLAKLTEPADQATLIDAKTALTDSQNAEVQNYTDAVTDVGSSLQDFSLVIDGMNDLLYGTTGYLNDQTVTPLGSTAVTYKNTAGVQFDKAKREETSLASQFAGITTSSSNAAVQAITTQALTTVTDMVSALKEAQTAASFVKTMQSSSGDQSSVKIADSAGTTAASNISTWEGEMTSHASALNNDLTSINTGPNNVAAKQSAYDKLVSGADPLDIESQQLALQQKQTAYDDSFITAPFDGVVAKVDVSVGDSVNSGTAVATVVTKDQVADVSLNEVDVAKVKTGDKVMLSFDAVDGLQISGVLSEIDQVGTVAQGVVSYSAKITFDTTDPRILPGMSVSASIITDSKSGVLTVPSSAVKTSNGSSYVLVFNPALTVPAGSGTTGVASTLTPTQVPVQIGASDDTSTEIVSGVIEGEQVVTRTIAPSTTATAAAAPSLLGGGSARPGAAGGAARRIGG